MNETNDISVEFSSEGEKKTVGGTLRKQRISMNISIEKISKDLRINKTYIEAVENDKYNLIPAAPYVRVYVKTIAEYLSLDPEKLLQLLPSEKDKAGFNNKGLPAGKERETSLSGGISEGKKNGKFGPTALLIIVLLVLAYFAMNKNNNLQGVENISASDSDSMLVITGEQSEDNLDDSRPDSLFRGDTLISDSVTVETSAPEKIELTLQVIKDSSYVMIISDGKIVLDRILRSPSRVITATANDSINVRSGARNTLEIFVNGNKVDIANATGIWTFSKSGTKNLTLAEWQRIRRASQ